MIHVKFAFQNGETATGEFDDYQDFADYMVEYFHDIRPIKSMEVDVEDSNNH